MRFSDAQMWTAARLFADLLLSNDVVAETMGEGQKGMALYSGDARQAKEVDFSESLDRALKAAGKLRQMSVDEDAYNTLVAELVLQLRESSEHGPIAHGSIAGGHTHYNRNPDANFLELRLSSQGTTSWEAGIAIDNAGRDLVAYGSPRVNVCLYTDGGLEVWDRETDTVVAVPYEGKPDVPYKRPAHIQTKLCGGADALAKMDNMQVIHCRYTSAYYYWQVDENAALPCLKDGQPTGETFLVKESLRYGSKPPYFLLLTPYNTFPDFDPKAIDAKAGSLTGIKRLDQYESIVTAGDINFYYTSRGLQLEVPAGQTKPSLEQGRLIHRPYRYFQVKTPTLLGYGSDRIIAQPGDWLTVNRGRDGSDTPKLYHYTQAAMEQAMASGMIVQCEAPPKPTPKNAPASRPS